MGFRFKVHQNKRNKQLMILLSKKELNIKKEKLLKFINIDKISFEYEDGK